MESITKLVFYIVNITSIFAAQNLEPAVTIRDLSGGHTLVGQNVTLECQITFNSSYISVEWKKPKNVGPAAYKEETFPNKNVNSTYLTISRLTIFQADERYRGLYGCKATHKEWEYVAYSDQLFVPVYGMGYHLVLIDQEGKFDPLKAEIKVGCTAHPSLTVTWFGKNNEPIMESSNFSVYKPYFTSSKTYNYYAKLQLKYISHESLGVYRINANNVYKNMSQTFNVFLEQQIQSSLSIDRIDGVQAVYKCSAAGLKKPEITWYFVPCKFCLAYEIQDEEKEWMKNPTFRNSGKLTFAGIEDDFLNIKFKSMVKSSMMYKVEELYVEDRGLLVSSYISLNLSQTGTLCCVTQDSVEMERFFYPDDGFDILISDDDGDMVKAKNVNYPIYGQYVKLLCAVSLYNYVDTIEWLHEGRRLVETNTTHELSEPFVFLDKTVHKLGFQFMSENQAGNYTCKVSNRKGNVQSKTVLLKFEKMQSFYPNVVLHDLNAGQGGNISLKCEVNYYKAFSEIVWGVADSSVEHVQEFLDHFSAVANITFTNITTTVFNSITNTTTSLLTIPESDTTPGLYYICGVSTYIFLSYSYLLIPIYGTNASVTVFHKNISVFDKHDMTIRIFMTVHPPPIIHWFDNKGTEIQIGSSKFSITTSHESIRSSNKKINCETALSFKSLHFQDFGKYTVVLDNDTQKSFTIEVNVTGVPSVKIDVDKLDENRMTSTLKCTSVAYPEPSIKWFFKKCTTLNSCLNARNGTKYQSTSKEELRHLREGLMLVSYISVNISERGLLRCQSTNSIGSNYTDQPIFHIENEFDFFVENATKRPLSNDFQFVGYKMLQIVCVVSSFFYKEHILWGYNMKYLYNLYKLPSEPKYYNLVFSTVSVVTSYSIVGLEKYYSCNCLTKEGILKSQTLTITSRGEAFVSIDKTNMLNSSTEVKLASNWKFYCYAEGFPTPVINWYKDNNIIKSSENVKITNNSQELDLTCILPEDEGTYRCEVSNNHTGSSKFHKLIISNKYTWLYVQLSLLLLAFVIACVLLIFKWKADKKSEQYLLRFERGALGKLNPELKIEDQGNLLPYDRRWEVPMENIKLGKQLGSGAFGIVFQAEVVNFFADENSRTVAIKTIDPHSDLGNIKDLTSELKIMAHLGRHVNIVNFLGACTKNIAKRELYIIVEYCRFGNLRNYMLCHSNCFIDQKNSEEDNFDDVQEKDDSVRIYSRDLLAWAFQITRGMEYLSSRRIVHGDLAARNVLLADNNVVKISDFGLSKKLYEIGNYTIKNHGPLPVKWLAIECLGKGIFSIESDVWSFGIVLWEIFSLGEAPYPGIVFDENFYDRIAAGYRMASPKAATTTIYNMMLDCWNADPQSRPSFTDLAARVGSLLNESLRNHYVDMNGGYVSMSRQESAVASEDVLMKVNPPTFANILSTLSGIATGTKTYVNSGHEPE